MSEHDDETVTPDEDAPEPEAAPGDDEGAADDEGEAGGGEGEGEGEQDEPEEPRDRHGLSESEREKRFVKAEKAAATYARRISDIYEEDALELVECPCCPVIHKGFVNVNDAGRVPPEIAQAVMMYLGFATKAELQPDPEHSPCGTCAALGKVATGSRVPGNDEKKCPSCQGYGYVPPPAQSSNGVAAVADFHAPAGEAEGPLSRDERDPTGEPRVLPDGRENPNFGKWPQFKQPVAPWGKTAGLTAQDAAA